MKSTILLVEDDPAGRELAAFNLRRGGHTVDVCECAEDALPLFTKGRHDVVVTDLRLPGSDGLTLLTQLLGVDPEVPVVVVTAFADVEVAVRAMKAGAFDFVGKPFNRDHLLLSVERALERRHLRSEVTRLRREVAVSGERPMVAVSPPMEDLLQLVDRVAHGEATVLITGETGTGKELVARRIHARSERSHGPFVCVNCAAIPGELLESELFGHERGAFTGAARARVGRFRQAAGGTILLDEIGELPLSLQAKLLRVLQERVVDVVGRDEPVAVDVRVVAASNRDLRRLVSEGQFREDLLYRLDVVSLRVPPLRERREDIVALVQFFVAQFSSGREIVVPDEVMAELTGRWWPGNVRQLQNACERMVLLSREGVAALSDLPVRDSAEFQPGVTSEEWPPLPSDGLDLVDLERRVIERALAFKRGNITQTAAYLRVPRHILAYRMAKYGIARLG
jgi:DNA-binding NtrC family response regulator